MDLPATHYGKLDNRNPVVSVFERDVKTFQMLMRRVTCASSQDNSSYAKGIKTLVEIWKKYKHRLPSKMYEERMLQVADFLVEIEMYEVALWQGYSLHLFQFSPLKITEVADVDQFMASFFPEGLDVDQDTFTLKIRAMLGCALCMLEREKRRRGFSQMGLCNLLQVLSFLRIMMQVLQQHEHLCWHVYNVSLHIYRICYYLMTMNCSAQALEYLLWASVSLELSVPIMTPEHLPWIVTLYCAVCRCYYDSQLPMQAEEFARRALGKIEKLARWEQENDVPVSRETQSAFREASIKLAALVFKRLVFENRKKIKPVFKPKTKLPNVPWPRTTTERALMSLFDSSAGYFVGILEALRDTGWCPQKEEHTRGIRSAGGENKVNVSSALSFIKLLFHFKQAETCGRLTKEMQQVLSALEGQSFRKAESELALLGSLNSLLCAERSRGRDDLMPDVRRRSLFQVSEELAGLVRALHSSVCLLSPEIRPDGGLVLDVVLFLWNKVKEVMQGDELQNPSFTYCVEKIDNFDKWLWCLFVLCEVTSVCDLVNMDCMVAAEMHYMLAVLLERAAESRHLTSTLQADPDEVRPTTFSLTATSRTELFQKVCEVVEWGFKALEKDGATMISHDGSAITDSVFMQVPAVPGECLLKIEGLEPNQKYVFAVAVYNTQGNMLGSSVGAKTLPILASMPIPLVSTWVHMAQVAYQTEQFALAKRACRTLWSHFTFPDNGSQRNQDRLATTTGLHTQILQCGSLHLCRRFLTSIFIETEINIQQGSLGFQSFSNNGPFIWEQEARLEECERMLVAMDLALWLNDGISALQAVVVCYGLLTPLIFHQVKHSPFVEVYKKD
ncbi:hypothetical protein fugu_009065 [Takifugu bimaculatus]|uniref:Uncharacterized protein n=1 Tax=Takifugu bimaculatus TaxID=433685 RepID=A0A4Z2AY90_9TELE|nr:hypothetical protein fugu_009065 [Takifugu bimaculatus]